VDIIDDRFRLVVIVASVGGLEAVSVILSDLPGSLPMAIAVVVHRTSRLPCHLAEVLSRSTKMPVKDAAHGDAVMPGHVYVAVPDLHLVVRADRTFALSGSDKVMHTRPAGDPLFESAAAAFGHALIGVVLTGCLSDGSDGIRTIKRLGGTTIAQSTGSSREPSMPRSAAATGDVDYVLPLDSIAGALTALAHGMPFIVGSPDPLSMPRPLSDPSVP
jgi:two-component system chemotaxis response regulator CheB